MKKIAIFCGSIIIASAAVLWWLKRHQDRQQVRERLENLKEVKHGQN